MIRTPPPGPSSSSTASKKASTSSTTQPIAAFSTDDGAPIPHAASWDGGAIERRDVIDVVDFVSAVGSADGSVHAISHTGRIRSDDADGDWSGEMLTGVDFPVIEEACAFVGPWVAT